MERISFEQQHSSRSSVTAPPSSSARWTGLPGEQRQAIEGRVLEEEPYAAIAAGIGCSEQVVRKRVSRGLATLRREMRKSA